MSQGGWEMSAQEEEGVGLVINQKTSWRRVECSTVIHLDVKRPRLSRGWGVNLKPCLGEKLLSEKNNDKVAGENGKVGPEGEQREAQRHRLGPSSLRVEKNGLEACRLEGK